MSHMKNLIFTDSVKDALCNDPVLDQFDIEYEASFYTTMQDDYVTGVLVRETVTQNAAGEKSRFYSTGSRGRVFSKYYADAELRNSSSPFLSIQLKDWQDLVSRSYRFSQFFDGGERMYDTCLPSIAKCLGADGTNVWLLSDVSASAPQDFLSPFRTVVGGNSYIFFDGVPSSDTDPTTNNSWMKSFPFEGRYVNATSAKRSVNRGDSIDLGTTDLIVSSSAVNQQRVNPISTFPSIPIPILPGRIDPKYLEGTSGRNGRRPGEILNNSALTLFPTGSFSDSHFGHSYLLPSEIYPNITAQNQNIYVNNGYVYHAQPVTSSMNVDDIIRLLYGFGDLNTATYSSYKVEKSDAVTVVSPGTELTPTTVKPKGVTYNFVDYVGTNLTGSATRVDLNDYRDIAKIYYDGSGLDSPQALSASWRQTNNSEYTWEVIKKQGQKGSVGSNLVYYVSASFNSPFRGVTWTPDPELNDDKDNWDAYILGSATARAEYTYNKLSPNPMYLPENAVSTAILEVTSSNPWYFTYDRIVAADPSDYLVSYFAGYPGNPSENLPFVPFDIVVGQNPAIGPNFVIGVKNYEYPYVIPPGEYRLNFSYVKNGTGPTSTGLIDRAFIKNLSLKVVNICKYPELAKPDLSSPIMGGNNYPKFRKLTADDRSRFYIKSKSYDVKKSARQYASNVFGISPIIRGWRYGLSNGFPEHTKAIFRRDRYGQLRDMLEQRKYTKCVGEPFSFDSPATTVNDKTKSDPVTFTVTPPPVSVNFVKQNLSVNSKGIGKILLTPVSPEETYSQNLSTEVTSSLPYFDFQVRSRENQSNGSVAGASVFSLAVDALGNLQIK